MSLEDLLVEVFAALLGREAQGIAEDARALSEAAHAYAEGGTLDPVEGQRLTELRMALRNRMKDREHTFSMVLAILDSLKQTADKALESLGK